MSWCVTDTQWLVSLDSIFEGQVKRPHIMCCGLLSEPIQSIRKCANIGQIFIKCSHIIMSCIFIKYHWIWVNETRISNALPCFGQFQFSVAGKKLKIFELLDESVLFSTFSDSFTEQRFNHKIKDSKKKKQNQPVWVLVVFRRRQYYILGERRLSNFRSCIYRLWVVFLSMRFDSMNQNHTLLCWMVTRWQLQAVQVLGPLLSECPSKDPANSVDYCK